MRGIQKMVPSIILYNSHDPALVYTSITVVYYAYTSCHTCTRWHTQTLQRGLERMCIYTSMFDIITTIILFVLEILLYIIVACLVLGMVLLVYRL